MNILDRYIGQAVIAGVLIVLSILTAIYFLFYFAGESNKIGEGSYTFWVAAQFALMQLPRQVYELFPLATLLGTMMGLGWLATHSELIVIRTAGVSLLRIVVAVMKTAVMLTFLAIIIGELIAPPFYQYASEIKSRALNWKVSLNTDYGLWARDGGTYIHVNRAENDGRLLGVNLYLFDSASRLKEQIRAEEAIYDNDQWKLKRVTHSYYEQDQVRIRKAAELPWKTLLDQDMVKVVSVEPYRLPIWKLYSYIHYLKANDLDYSSHELAFWTKLVSPLTILAMVLLAVPFVFVSVRHITMGKQIMMGFLLGISFYIFNRLSGQLGIVYELPPLLSALLPTLVIMAVSTIAYRRLR